ncbi:MAG: disk-shape morphogenesis protein volactin [Candidatus Thorarchaeota archaeon]|jgi:actin-like ATPase involved in cell morphogenesis
MSIGMDCGTYNLICCSKDEGNKVVTKGEVNAFLKMPLDNRFVFNMMKNAGVPLIEWKEENAAFALGKAAVDLAYTMTDIELKRPMKDGCLNPKEKMSQAIMAQMIHGLLADSVKQDKEILYYSVPANALNEETDADYHQKILEAIFNDFNKSPDGKPAGPIVEAHPINEALALVYAELASEQWTGIGISFGAGMVNLCFAMFGAPIFEFSIVNSGDWIDKMTAKATGETPTFINKEKLKTDLTERNPESLVQRAIHAQYQIMIQKTVSVIKEGLEGAGNKARHDKPISVVIAGGTSSPKGFDKLFAEVLTKANVPIEIGKVIHPKDPLHSVARGCLVAAENAAG